MFVGNACCILRVVDFFGVEVPGGVRAARVGHHGVHDAFKNVLADALDVFRGVWDVVFGWTMLRKLTFGGIASIAANVTVMVLIIVLLLEVLKIKYTVIHMVHILRGLIMNSMTVHSILL